MIMNTLLQQKTMERLRLQLTNTIGGNRTSRESLNDSSSSSRAGQVSLTPCVELPNTNNSNHVTTMLYLRTRLLSGITLPAGTSGSSSPSSQRQHALTKLSDNIASKRRNGLLIPLQVNLVFHHRAGPGLTRACVLTRV